MHNPGRAEEYERTEEDSQDDYQEGIRTVLGHVTDGIPLNGLDDDGFLRKPHAEASDDTEDQAEYDFGPFHDVQQFSAGAGTFFTNGALSVSMVRIAAVHDLLGARVDVRVGAGQSPGDGLAGLGSLVERELPETGATSGDGLAGLGSLARGGRLGFLEHFTERLTHFDHHYPTFL